MPSNPAWGNRNTAPQAISSQIKRRKSCPTSGIPSPRQLQVEALLCSGYTQTNVAAILGVSENTINAHVQALFRSRNVHDKVGLLLSHLERNGIWRPAPLDLLLKIDGRKEAQQQ